MISLFYVNVSAIDASRINSISDLAGRTRAPVSYIFNLGGAYVPNLRTHYAVPLLSSPVTPVRAGMTTTYVT